PSKRPPKCCGSRRPRSSGSGPWPKPGCTARSPEEAWMTPERFRQVEQLFESALEREASQRAAFLQEACAADPPLRRQVEALLASHEQAPNFLETLTLQVLALPLTEGEAQSMAGQHIGPYELLREIGRGGMGEVYLAQNQRLGRQVALKFLPVSFQDDPDRRARLLTEARAASSLHSPQIATIHDIGEHEGHAFIVMEYVEGEPLSQKLKGGRSPSAKRSTSASRLPRRWRRRTGAASSTATSRAPTWWSPRGGRCRCSI